MKIQDLLLISRWLSVEIGGKEDGEKVVSELVQSGQLNETLTHGRTAQALREAQYTYIV